MTGTGGHLGLGWQSNDLNTAYSCRICTTSQIGGSSTNCIICLHLKRYFTVHASKAHSYDQENGDHRSNSFFTTYWHKFLNKLPVFYNVTVFYVADSVSTKVLKLVILKRKKPPHNLNYSDVMWMLKHLTLVIEQEKQNRFVNFYIEMITQQSS